MVAQVRASIDASSLGAAVEGQETLVDTRFSGCSLHCLVNVSIFFQGDGSPKVYITSDFSYMIYGVLGFYAHFIFIFYLLNFRTYY